MISPGEDILASDFVDSPSGAADEGKVAKLDAAGKIDPGFLHTEFGGTGADGALSISSGTTTLDLAGAQVFVKNYTSISITGTGKLAFSNPHANGTTIILRSQGDVTLTSSQTPMIDISNCGAAGGSGVTIGASVGANGSNGSKGIGLFFETNFGGGGTHSATPTGPGGVVPTALTFAVGLIAAAFFKYAHFLVPGAGGGGGGAENASGTNSTSGSGGRGAGALAIECNGTFTFTTAGGLSTTGTVGGNATLNSGSNAHAGGGGGGGGGVIAILYKIAGSITGTVTTTAAAGGTTVDTGSSLGDGKSPNAGGGGGSLSDAGADGTSQGSGFTAGEGSTGLSIIQRLNT